MWINGDPSSGLQTATIVGLQGEILTTERNHRVKVQFAWQRNTTPAWADIHNAPANETSGTWVRVSEALAGPNWGTQFAPRIGCEFVTPGSFPVQIVSVILLRIGMYRYPEPFRTTV